MGVLEHQTRHLFFLITPTKHANPGDLSIAILFSGVPLLVDDDFLWSSDSIEPELRPPDSNGTPSKL
jgi:hypothetical protein